MTMAPPEGNFGPFRACVGDSDSEQTRRGLKGFVSTAEFARHTMLRDECTTLQQSALVVAAISRHARDLLSRHRRACLCACMRACCAQVLTAAPRCSLTSSPRQMRAEHARARGRGQDLRSHGQRRRPSRGRRRHGRVQRPWTHGGAQRRAPRGLAPEGGGPRPAGVQSHAAPRPPPAAAGGDTHCRAHARRRGARCR